MIHPTKFIVSKILLSMVVPLLSFGAGGAFAQSPDVVARESEAKVAATASAIPTPQMVIDKVDQAVALLRDKGRAALPMFKGKDSDFIFAGTYIWIHDEDGVMRMHPLRYKLEGKNLSALRDAGGKRFVAQMTRVAKERGAGWVDYLWPEPGKKGASRRISYVKGVTVNGKGLVVGCAVSGMSEADMDKLLDAK